jgi:hypothetical protein
LWQLFSELKVQRKGGVFKNAVAVYDGMKNIYASKKLNFGGKETLEVSLCNVNEQFSWLFYT